MQKRIRHTNPLCGVYAIRNGDRSYIGHSTNMGARWTHHRSGLRRGVHPNPHLQNAWNKYGEDAFTFEILEKCPADKLFEREQYWMDQHLDKYNTAPVAGSLVGFTHTDAAKAKISEAKIGNQHAAGHVQTSEHRAKISAAMKGKRNAAGFKHSDEVRARMSEAAKERWARRRSES